MKPGVQTTPDGAPSRPCQAGGRCVTTAARDDAGRVLGPRQRHTLLSSDSISEPDDLDGVRPDLERLADRGVELGHLLHAFLEGGLAAGVDLGRAELHPSQSGTIAWESTTPR